MSVGKPNKVLRKVVSEWKSNDWIVGKTYSLKKKKSCGGELSCLCRKGLSTGHRLSKLEWRCLTCSGCVVDGM